MGRCPGDGRWVGPVSSQVVMVVWDAVFVVVEGAYLSIYRSHYSDASVSFCSRWLDGWLVILVSWLVG